MSASPRTSTAIRFTPAVYERLTEEAQARDMSVNRLVDRLCAEGLERLIPIEEALRLTR